MWYLFLIQGLETKMTKIVKMSNKYQITKKIASNFPGFKSSELLICYKQMFVNFSRIFTIARVSRLQ